MVARSPILLKRVNPLDRRRPRLESRHDDFDWKHTTALPESLSSKFHGEPLYIDLRKFRTIDQLSLRHSPFHDAILDIAVPLHHKDKDELDGVNIRLERKYRIVRRIVVTALSVLNDKLYPACRSVVSATQ
jgi:hypothetical protein